MEDIINTICSLNSFDFNPGVNCLDFNILDNFNSSSSLIGTDFSNVSLLNSISDNNVENAFDVSSFLPKIVLDL